MPNAGNKFVFLIALFLILLLTASGPIKLPDENLKNACGPIACFSALRALEVDTSFAEVAKRCHWEEGKNTTLSDMLSALESYPSIRVSALRDTPPRLLTSLNKPDTLAIVFYRTPQMTIDHSVAILGAHDNKFLFIDYPTGLRWFTLDQLKEVWDGRVFYISKISTQPQNRLNLWSGLLPVIALAVCCFVIVLRAAHSNRIKQKDV